MTQSVSAVMLSARLDDGTANCQVPSYAQNLAETAKKFEPSKAVPVDRVVQALESYIDSNQTLEIFVDKETGNMVVKVISYEDGKVIREIPPEEVLNHAVMIEQFEELMFDEVV